MSDQQSVESELLEGASAPLLNTDQQDRLDLTKAAHTFGSIPSAHNFDALLEVFERFNDAEVDDAEQERFDLLVLHTEEQRGIAARINSGGEAPSVDDDTDEDDTDEDDTDEDDTDEDDTEDGE